MQCYKFLIGVFLLLMTSAVFSQESADPQSKNNEYSGKQSSDWEKIQLDLGTVKGKLEAQTGVVKNLIEAKNQLKGEALDLILEELKNEYQKLQKTTDDYNKLNQEYLTKFPERGTKVSRVYKRIKTKTLQAFENELTIRGRVGRLHNKILSQYPNSNIAPKKSRVKSQIQDKTKIDNSKKPDADDVTDQIKLKK